MEIFKELNKLGYEHYTKNTIGELDDLPLNSEERIMEQALVFRWFRKYPDWPIESWIQPYLSEQPRQYEGFYWRRGEKVSVGVFSTYDEAQLNLLHKLIEIVKNK
jgi:hypothetical protein